MIYQARVATGERDEHTLNVLTSLETDTSGFAGHYGNQSLAHGVQSVGEDEIERIVLGRQVHDDGDHWYC